MPSGNKLNKTQMYRKTPQSLRRMFPLFQSIIRFEKNMTLVHPVSQTVSPARILFPFLGRENEKWRLSTGQKLAIVNNNNNHRSRTCERTLLLVMYNSSPQLLFSAHEELWGRPVMAVISHNKVISSFHKR